MQSFQAGKSGGRRFSEPAWMILEGSFLAKEGSEIVSEGSFFIFEGSFPKEEYSKMNSEGSFAEKEVSFFIKEPSEMFLFDHPPESVSTNCKAPVPQRDKMDTENLNQAGLGNRFAGAAALADINVNSLGHQLLSEKQPGMDWIKCPCKSVEQEENDKRGAGCGHEIKWGHTAGE
jgi:hypothetical protein